MASLLLLLAFAHSLFGAPLTFPENPSSHGDPHQLLQARDSSNMFDSSRTIRDVVWSCLATIFACTWVAVHPNIPSPKADWKERFKERLVVMAYAWIAPECVTMWAMRQWFSARKLVRMYNERRGIPEDTRGWIRTLWKSLCPSEDDDDILLGRWTLTHGFFAQMGGYMIFREKQPYWTLFLEDVDLERDMNLVPYYTEEELMDRSKGDILSKGVALLQTAWFVTQYFTRLCYKLPLTELETVTLAFAVLNFATYILWLHKPLNVQCPIRVYEQPSASPTVRPESRTQLYDHHIRSESPTSLDSQLPIPVFAFDDIADNTDTAEWEELRETPWFCDSIPTDDGATVSGSPSSGSQTLASTPRVDVKELEKSDVDGFPCREVEGVQFSEEDDWGELNEVPWFPTPEVLFAAHRDEASVMGHKTRPTGSIHNHHNQVRWSYSLPWRIWRSLPRGMVILTVDGGWYTIHISHDVIQDDGLTSFDTRNNPLSIDFYVPLFLRNQSWALQIWIVLPFWLPYIIFVALYSFGPYPFFMFLLSPLAAMTGTSQMSQEPWLDPRYPLQVPAFFAGPMSLLDINSRLRIWYTLFFLASVFGSSVGLPTSPPQ